MPNKKIKFPLSKTHPKLAREAHGWDPSTVSKSSKQKFEWICSNGHFYKQSPSYRTRLDARPRKNEKNLDSKIPKSVQNCPICNGYEIVKGVNDLESTFPSIAKEAFGWDPTKVTSGTSKKLNWKCPNQHTYSASVSVRTGRNTGCPYCANKKILIGFNDLATTHPELAKEAVGWDPTGLTFGSQKKVNWKCKKGHFYVVGVYKRTGRGSSCPYCSGRKVLVGFNDLATTHPKLAKEILDVDPLTVSKGYIKKLKWKCNQNHIFAASINQRTNRNSGCPICTNQKVLSGFNDLATTNPDIAKELINNDPTKIISGGKLKFNWACTFGHNYAATIDHRKQGKGCPYCSNRKVLAGFNDLATTNPDIAKELVNNDPTKIISGSDKKYTWECSKGHRWKTRVEHRKSGTGCPSCAKFGYDLNEPGYLYFLEHLTRNMFQIGITNVPNRRLIEHKKSGWELLELRGPMDGDLAKQWETAILRMLKAEGADLTNKEIAGKFDGYSEAWSKSTFPVKSIKELMRLTEAFEEGK